MANTKVDIIETEGGFECHYGRHSYCVVRIEKRKGGYTAGYLFDEDLKEPPMALGDVFSSVSGGKNKDIEHFECQDETEVREAVLKTLKKRIEGLNTDYNEVGFELVRLADSVV